MKVQVKKMFLRWAVCGATFSWVLFAAFAQGTIPIPPPILPHPTPWPTLPPFYPSPVPPISVPGKYFTMECESENYQEERCELGITPSKVTLLQQHSEAQCIEFVDFEVTKKEPTALYVRNGCRATFAIWK
jgi:Protein of unknown function (DUF3011)